MVNAWRNRARTRHDQSFDLDFDAAPYPK